MKKTLILFVISLFAILPIMAYGQTGTIAGKVTIENTGNALSDAAVFLGDSKTGTYTKKDGSFILRNVPVGDITITSSFMGYKQQTKEIVVRADETTVVNFTLAIEAVKLSGIKVNATRAIKRETPIAFTDLDQDAISNKYTTEDVPQLLSNVPGLFSSTGGLGEGELKVRGFDQDKVQILINGIPVNDPESQQVYWSNWTGLSSNIKSVQVQRGAGSSLYGSGAFGGSVNIETIGAGADVESGWTARISYGGYSVSDEVADGKGGMEEFSPINYNLMARYNSGNLKGGKFNYAVSVERKLGSSYQVGTKYDGWSFGAELQNLWGNHKVNTSLIAAPQKHNQARATTDMELEEKLGRNYNRNNNKEQENYYNKPQLSIRDEWKINDQAILMTNFFLTMGNGGGKYERNDKFDVETGRVFYQSISDYADNKYFGRHARYVYERTGVVLDGYVPEDTTFNGSFVSKARNLPNSDYSHSWHNDSQNNHNQWGLNTYLDYTFNEMVKGVVGGEFRHWRGVHHAYTRDLRYTGGVHELAEDRYNYDGIVTNFSVFARTQINPLEGLTLLADVQYGSYTSKVEENPIEIFDFNRGIFTGNYYYATMTDDTDEDDYEKTYDFLSPKAGINYNITENINILSNFSIAYKEPRVTDWYSRSGGPDANQTYYDDNGAEVVVELDPEKATTIEFGAGYSGIGWNVNANYYMTTYEDKIESSLQQNGEYLTVNAGEAEHKGLELEAAMDMGNLDASLAVTMGENRWTKMNVDKIFHIDADEIVGKVVPYAPEQMANFAVGYTIPLENSHFRIGFSGNWWDEYYATYSNMYTPDNNDPFDDVLGEEIEAKLPSYLAINSDLSYNFILGGKEATLRLDLKNINNKEDNYMRAYESADYGRTDDLNGVYTMYVQPAALFSAFVTAEVRF